MIICFEQKHCSFLMKLTHIVDLLHLVKLEYDFWKPVWFFVLPGIRNGKVRVCLHFPGAQWSYRIFLHREEVGVWLHAAFLMCSKSWCQWKWCLPAKVVLCCKFFHTCPKSKGAWERRLLVLGSIDNAPSDTVPLCVVSKHSSQVL